MPFASTGGSAVAVYKRGFLEASLLFLDVSGSLIKMHSRPREEHLEQGYCKLHFTLDSAHALKSIRFEGRKSITGLATYLTRFAPRFVHIPGDINERRLGPS